MIARFHRAAERELAAAEVMANSMTAPIGIRARRSRRLKYSLSFLSSSALGRRLRSEHDPNPDEIVHDRGGAGSRRAARADMLDQGCRGQGQGVRLADRAALEILQVPLLGTAPLGDGLKGIDVPANELAERDRLALPQRLGAGFLELDLRGAWPSSARPCGR